MGQRRKSHNKLEKKPATSRYSPSANGKGTKNSTSSRASRSPDTRKGPVTSHRGRGGSGGGGASFASGEQRPPGAPRRVQASVARSCTRSLSLSGACPPPGARPTWGPRRPLCSPRRPHQRAEAGGRAEGESEAARAGARGWEGRAGTQGAQPAGSRANVPVIRAPAGGTRGAPATAPSSQQEVRDPPPSAVTLHTHLPTPWLPTAGSHRYPATQSFATPKATGKKVFLGLSLPLPRPRAQESSRKSEITTCRLRRPPSPPWPGQRAQGGCPARRLPAPARGQAPWDAARPTHHGDSHRGRASAGRAAGELGLWE